METQEKGIATLLHIYPKVIQ